MYYVTHIEKCTNCFPSWVDEDVSDYYRFCYDDCKCRCHSNEGQYKSQVPLEEALKDLFKKNSNLKEIFN